MLLWIVIMRTTSSFSPAVSAKELLPIPPRGKHCFGVVTVGENGAFQLPEKALKLFSIRPGDALLVLGEEGNGIAMLKQSDFLQKMG